MQNEVKSPARGAFVPIKTTSDDITKLAREDQYVAARLDNFDV